MPLQITIQDIRARHPKGVNSPTDFYYMNLANRLLAITNKSLIASELTQEMKQRIALSVALYFEDVISDTGIWRSFVEKNQQLYGRRLPFYDIEGEYEPDEPHHVDVQLIVWDSMMAFKYESVVNPENLGVAFLSESLFHYIDGEFEQAPINEALADYFRECRFMDDFYHMRDALKFFVFSCYLTNGRYVEDYLNSEIETSMKYIDTPDMAYYDAECVMAYQYRIGPLALLPQEWLGMVLRTVGKTVEAADVEAIRWRDYEPYLLEQYDSKGFTLCSIDDEQLSLTYHNMAQKDDSIVSKRDFVMAMFVCYRGEWHLNGPASWGNGKKIYDNVREEMAKKQSSPFPNHEELVQQNGGSPLFYFKDIAEAHAFIAKATGAKFQGKMPEGWKKDDKSVVLYLSPTSHIFAMAPGAAECISDPNNPYYNKNAAKENALALVIQNSVPGEMLRYLIANDMIPDACLKSMTSPERGRELLQQNIDFMARALRRDDYWQ